MVDCGATGDCAIPMWFQYVILGVAFLLFAIRCSTTKGPYDRM